MVDPLVEDNTPLIVDMPVVCHSPRVCAQDEKPMSEIPALKRLEA